MPNKKLWLQWHDDVVEVDHLSSQKSDIKGGKVVELESGTAISVSKNLIHDTEEIALCDTIDCFDLDLMNLHDKIAAIIKKRSKLSRRLSKLRDKKNG